MARPAPSFLLLTFPAAGHIKPALELAKRLIDIGASVTLSLCDSARPFLAETDIPKGLTLFGFSDGYDHGVRPRDDLVVYMAEFKRRGTQAIGELIDSRAKDGIPISCMLYTLLLPWVTEIARDKQVPSAFLWPQPAIVLDIYYYYLNGYRDSFDCCVDPSYVLELPGLPPLTSRDLPSFLSPSNVHTTTFLVLQEQLKNLYQDTNTVILANTFDALEPEALKSTGNKKLIGIGPLNPDKSSDKSKDSLSFNADVQGTEDYINWLNTKPKASVVYASFGSLAILSDRQIEEITHGLLDTNRPFLWVIRTDQKLKEADIVSTRRDEIRERGMIVPWCSQLEVLSHPSTGCFLTHCGWNSTMETLVHGIPVVGFPQWADQRTNAKLIEDVWKTGVRVVPNEEGIVEMNEIKRCLDLVMGDEEIAKQMNMNAKKFKDLARDAMEEGGSSDKNLRAFVEQVAEGLI